MSAAGATSSAATAAAVEKCYFCHQCNRTFTSAGTGLACAHCHGDFVEEFDLPEPEPDPNPIPPPNPNHDFLFHFDFEEAADAFFSIPSLFSAIMGFAATIESPSAPFVALRDLIRNLPFARDGGGENQFIGSIGDYFVGPGLEQLIQQLAENDPNRYGTPPASTAAVASLPGVLVTEGLLASDEAQCSVCMDPFEMGLVAKKMPCNHIYHEECILPWLELHNSCPICRCELPTDDPDYEHYKEHRANARNQSGAGASTARALDGDVEANSSENTENFW